jgi:ubiquinone/menaquinone biosynthesis C-methylase UbiE
MSLPLSEDHKRFTRDSYDKTAQEYARNVAGLHPEKFGIKFCRKLPPQGHILDLGCGSGRDTIIFVVRGYHVTGLDFSEKLLEEARKTCRSAQFILGDIENLKFSNNSFDGVWACASLLHVPKKNMPQVLTEIHRILVPGGILAITLKEGDWEGYEKDSRYDGQPVKFFSYWRKKPLIILIEMAGFRIIKIKRTSPQSDYATHTFHQIICKKLERSRL